MVVRSMFSFLTIMPFIVLCLTSCQPSDTKPTRLDDTISQQEDARQKQNRTGILGPYGITPIDSTQCRDFKIETRDADKKTFKLNYQIQDHFFKVNIESDDVDYTLKYDIDKSGLQMQKILYKSDSFFEYRLKSVANENGQKIFYLCADLNSTYYDVSKYYNCFLAQKIYVSEKSSEIFKIEGILLQNASIGESLVSDLLFDESRIKTWYSVKCDIK